MQPSKIVLYFLQNRRGVFLLLYAYYLALPFTAFFYSSSRDMAMALFNMFSSSSSLAGGMLTIISSSEKLKTAVRIFFTVAADLIKLTFDGKGFLLLLLFLFFQRHGNGPPQHILLILIHRWRQLALSVICKDIKVRPTLLQYFEPVSVAVTKWSPFSPTSTLVIPSPSKSGWTEENLPRMVLYWMISLMAAPKTSMLSMLVFLNTCCTANLHW